MRGRPYYRSRLLVTGLSLLVLGTGNALIGGQKLAQYQRVVAEGRARGYFADAGVTGRILRPLDDEGERYNIARAKVDLYLVILNGGLLMAGIGTVLTLLAWARLRFRRDDAGTLGSSAMSAPRPGAPA